MSEPGIDTGALGAWLETHVPGFRPPFTLTKFATGQSNPTYRIDAESGALVLRAKPPGQLLKSAHQVDREFRVLEALRPAGVPVPRALALCPDDPSPIGRMFYVMELVEGRIFWDPALPELSGPAERAAIYQGMNAALARLHDVDPAAVGLADFGRPGSYFERQLSRWAGQYSASETGAIVDMDRLIDWLESNLPADDGAVSLVHGDFRLDNMIFDAHRPEVAAIIDWELSTLGHPMADLAYQCMQWRLPHDSGFRGLGGIDRDALGLPSFLGLGERLVIGLGLASEGGVEQGLGELLGVARPVAARRRDLVAVVVVEHGGGEQLPALGLPVGDFFSHHPTPIGHAVMVNDHP